MLVWQDMAMLTYNYVSYQDKVTIYILCISCIQCRQIETPHFYIYKKTCKAITNSFLHETFINFSMLITSQRYSESRLDLRYLYLKLATMAKM